MRVKLEPAQQIQPSKRVGRVPGWRPLLCRSFNHVGAVADSEAGYTVGLVRHGDTLTLRQTSNVHLGDPIPIDEIDLSDDAALLWADYAAELVADKTRPPLAPGDTRAGVDGTGVQTPVDGQEAGSGVAPSATKKPPAVDVIQSADVSARFNRDGLFDLQRALAWLRDKPATVTVDVRIHIEGELPRTEFRNAVIEPIEEHGHDVTITMG